MNTKPNQFELKLIDHNFFNKWQMERHYLHRPIVRSKLLAHGIFVNECLVGGLLWATVHFTKKKGLFGYEGLPDKWEVLMLARFYLEDGCGVIASSALSESIGNGSGKGRRAGKKRGWRLQEDWCRQHPPKFPENPFVPRLLVSWSDTKYGHVGTIYKSSGWRQFDETKCNTSRNGERGTSPVLTWQLEEGLKRSWILHLPENKVAHQIGLERYKELH